MLLLASWPDRAAEVEHLEHLLHPPYLELFGSGLSPVLNGYVVVPR